MPHDRSYLKVRPTGQQGSQPTRKAGYKIVMEDEDFMPTAVAGTCFYFIRTHCIIKIPHKHALFIYANQVNRTVEINYYGSKLNLDKILNTVLEDLLKMVCF